MIMKNHFKPISQDMQVAFDNKRYDVIKELLNSGESPDLIVQDKDRVQYSFFIKALIEKKYKIAKLLMQYDADTNVKFKNYDPLNKSLVETTSLLIARKQSKTDTNQLLAEILQKLEERARLSPEPHIIPPENLPAFIPPKVLIDAVREGDLNSTKMLITRGMDVNQLDKNFVTGYQVSVLILSISCRQLHIAKYLLEKGARTDFVFLNYDEEQKETYNVTALTAATDLLGKGAEKGVGDIIDLIQRKSQDLRKEDPYIIIAPNVPRDLYPSGYHSSRILLPRESTFQIPQIRINSISEEGVSQGMNEEDKVLKEKIKTAKKKAKSEKSASNTNREVNRQITKIELQKAKRNKTSEICVIL